MATDKTVHIFDTTLRDGEQGPGFHLTPPEKQRVAEQLDVLSVDVIEAGFPASSPADWQAVRTIAETVGQRRDTMTIAALSRCVEADIIATAEAVRPAKNPRVHVFLGTSDIHLEHKLRISRDEALYIIERSVRTAKTYAKDVEFSAEDASRSDVEFLAKAVQIAVRAGATVINIPDTVGYAVPEQFGGLIRSLFERVPELHNVVVSVHTHDDLGMAVSNAVAAVQAGARQIECTINGVGERAGNCSLEEVVMLMKTRRDYFGVDTGIQTQHIGPVSRMVSEMMQAAIAPNKAVVGKNAFSHASGVHQSGMLRHASTYEIIRPEDVGMPPTQMVLSARSGRAAVGKRLTQLGIEIPTDAFDRFFARFKTAADQERIVVDETLMALAREVY